ncbi:MAG: hypothetical protein ACRC0L_02050, partial [Angustibacter sp.]
DFGQARPLWDADDIEVQLAQLRPAQDAALTRSNPTESGAAAAPITSHAPTAPIAPVRTRADASPSWWDRMTPPSPNSPGRTAGADFDVDRETQVKATFLDLADDPELLLAQWNQVGGPVLAEPSVADSDSGFSLDGSLDSPRPGPAGPVAESRERESAQAPRRTGWRSRFGQLWRGPAHVPEPAPAADPVAGAGPAASPRLVVRPAAPAAEDGPRADQRQILPPVALDPAVASSPSGAAESPAEWSDDLNGAAQLLTDFEDFELAARITTQEEVAQQALRQVREFRRLYLQADPDGLSELFQQIDEVSPESPAFPADFVEQLREAVMLAVLPGAPMQLQVEITRLGQTAVSLLEQLAALMGSTTPDFAESLTWVEATVTAVINASAHRQELTRSAHEPHRAAQESYLTFATGEG